MTTDTKTMRVHALRAIAFESLKKAAAATRAQNHGVADYWRGLAAVTLRDAAKES